MVDTLSDAVGKFLSPILVPREVLKDLMMAGFEVVNSRCDDAATNAAKGDDKQALTDRLMAEEYAKAVRAAEAILAVPDDN